MPRHIILTVGLVLALSGCGSAGVGAGDLNPSAQASEPRSGSETPGAATAVDDNPTADETVATEDDISDGQSDAADPVPDAETIEFLRRGLWNVPEQETLCSGGERPPSTLMSFYHTPSDDGDFYAICMTSPDQPDWPAPVRVVDPLGTTMTTAMVRASGEEEEVSGYQVDPLIVVTDSGLPRYNGLGMTEGDTYVTQLHMWLPHDRRSGTWTIEVAGLSDGLIVSAPCATAQPADTDPLLWPLDINFIRGGEGNLARHCLAFPDVTNGSVTEARAAVDAVHQRRGSAPADYADPTERCGTEPAGTVVDQDPEAGSYPHSTLVAGSERVDLVVSTGPCATSSSDPTESGGQEESSPSASEEPEVATVDPLEPDPAPTAQPEEDPS